MESQPFAESLEQRTLDFVVDVNALTGTRNWRSIYMAPRFLVAICVLALKAELAMLCSVLSASALELTQIEVEEVCERECEAVSTSTARTRQRRCLESSPHLACVPVVGDAEHNSLQAPALLGHRLTASVLAPLRC